MPQIDDHPLRAFANAVRQRFQARTARWQQVVGSLTLAAVGAAFGLGLALALGGASSLAWVGPWAGTWVGTWVATGCAAVLALVIGLVTAWLSIKPEQPPVPTTKLLQRVAAAPDDAAAVRDALTGAYTQRYFIIAADREWSRIRRHGEDAAMLMIDVDHLRQVNEQHGADGGDAVLVQVTRIVGATLRQYDLMARFNAGVLVVYLPHTDPIGAIDVAERIRDSVANFRMAWPTGSVAVTVSVGVAAIGADHAALDSVIGDAGAALRLAKAAGRNCVRAGPVPPRRQPADGTRLGDHRPH